MLPAPTPADDTARIARLEALGVLDAPDDAALDSVASIAAAALAAPMSAVSLVERDTQFFRAHVGLPCRVTGRGPSFCGHVVASDEPLVVKDTHADPRFADNPLVTGEPWIRFYAGHPVRHPDGSVLGTLCVMDTEPRRFGREQRRLLQQLACVTEAALAARAARNAQELLTARLARARRQSMIDPLLRTWNRAAIMAILENRTAAAVQQRAPLSVLMLDVDHFKSVNDRHGHQAGDTLLLAIARALRAAVRVDDEVGRYGGEEFLAVLPGVRRLEGLHLADRVRRAIAGTTITIGKAKLCRTVSIGLAEWNADGGESIESLIERADVALLEAKRSGRNRVVGAAPDELALEMAACG